MISRIRGTTSPENGRSLFVLARRYKSSTPTSYSLASSLESATSFLISMRRRAAIALTETLSIDDKRDLLEKIQGKDLFEEPEPKSKHEDDSLLLKNSIAEAVAQARIEESQKQEEKWEKVKEGILQKAEKAATERVASQFRIQKFNQWQEEVERAKSTSISEESTHTLGAQEVQEEHHHPVLGKACATLGYKSVHLVSANDLADIPVWEKQRIYRHDRARGMAQDKLKTLKLGMPGIITLYEVSRVGFRRKFIPRYVLTTFGTRIEVDN